MDSTPKPWERSFRNFRSDSHINSTQSSGLKMTDGNGDLGAYVPGPPPPLPPRPDQQTPPITSYGQSRLYGGMYSPYNTSGMYNQYRMMGYGPYSGGSDGWFNQFVEDGPKQAFQSIEAMVRAVSSVSMMLESTYQAVFSSFQAIIGVADHLSHTKEQLGQILSAIAIVRFLKNIVRRILSFIRGDGIGLDEAWEKMAAETVPDNFEESDLKRGRSNWPLIVFFAVVFGGPWLIWKIFNSLGRKAESKSWMSGEVEGFIGVAQYAFTAANNRELSFQPGQTIRLAPKDKQPNIRGWLLASVNGKTTGLVPANYLKISKFRPASVTSSQIEDPALKQ